MQNELVRTVDYLGWVFVCVRVCFSGVRFDLDEWMSGREPILKFKQWAIERAAMALNVIVASRACSFLVGADLFGILLSPSFICPLFQSQSLFYIATRLAVFVYVLLASTYTQHIERMRTMDSTFKPHVNLASHPFFFVIAIVVVFVMLRSCSYVKFHCS